MIQIDKEKMANVEKKVFYFVWKIVQIARNLIETMFKTLRRGGGGPNNSISDPRWDQG